MKKMLAGACALVAMIALSGCVTTEKVAVNQVGDENLSCADIKAQSGKLDQVAQEAQEHKGVNTANVAAVILFWPAAVGNYMDADSAEKLIEKRRAKLAGLYTDKRCH